MLKLFANPYRDSWLALGAVVSLFVACLLFAPPQQGEQNNSNPYQQSSDITSPSSTDERLADYTLGLEIFTGILAVFTVVLAGASIWQGQLTRQSIALARAEFVANQRPKIRVRNIVVKCPTGPGRPPPILFEVNQFVGGQFYAANVGGTAATIVEYLAIVRWSQEELPMERPYEGRNGTEVNIRVEPGASIPLPFQSTRLMDHNGNEIRAGQSGWRLRVMGWVEYLDESKVRRRTAFCRCYASGTGRISVKENEDYDYEE